jgi:hypothetical protein
VTQIIKTVIQVTVLHREDETVEGVPLSVIGHEIEDGDWLGACEVIASAPVDADRLEAEQVALGNDGTFFGEEL